MFWGTPTSLECTFVSSLLCCTVHFTLLQSILLDNFYHIFFFCYELFSKNFLCVVFLSSKVVFIDFVVVSRHFDRLRFLVSFAELPPLFIAANSHVQICFYKDFCDPIIFAVIEDILLPCLLHTSFLSMFPYRFYFLCLLFLYFYPRRTRNIHLLCIAALVRFLFVCHFLHLIPTWDRGIHINVCVCATVWAVAVSMGVCFWFVMFRWTNKSKLWNASIVLFFVCLFGLCIFAWM